MDYSLDLTERTTLQSWLATDRSAITRNVPAEFAERSVAQLKCNVCHGQVEGVPNFDLIGEKLRPEWSARFIAGEIADKPRPWLDAQMPSFPMHAKGIAQGLAMQQGLPPKSAVATTNDVEACETGRRLVSAVPRVSVVCNATRSVQRQRCILESAGINLAVSGARLQAGFFKRWVRKPSAIDPQSKMPTFFDDEGRSPLVDVYGGDGEKQISAIWQYLQLGEKMVAP